LHISRLENDWVLRFIWLVDEAKVDIVIINYRINYTDYYAALSVRKGISIVTQHPFCGQH